MSKTRDQQELEHFLGSNRELEEKFKRGDIQRVNYLIRSKHIKAQLFERAPLAHHALTSAEQLLNHWTMHTMVERAAREKLMDWDLEALQAWQAEYTTLNLAPLTVKVLAALESVVKIPFPEPRPEAVESMKKMRNHQMVPTPAAHTPSKEPKPPAKLVYHSDHPGDQRVADLVAENRNEKHDPGAYPHKHLIEAAPRKYSPNEVSRRMHPADLKGTL